MASTIQTANGPYIVIPQSNVHTVQGLNTVPATGTDLHGVSHRELLKGQPKALGVVQIMVAVTYVFLGIILLFTIDSFQSISIYSGISFWGALLYIISGSLCIAAEHKNSLSLIQASLGMNIISSLASLAAIGLYSTDLAYYALSWFPICTESCIIYRDYVFLLRELAISFLLISSVLEFCVAVSISSFVCRSLDERNLTPPQVIVIGNDYQNQNPAMNPHPFANIYQPSLDRNIINTTPVNGNFKPTTLSKVNTTLPLADSISGNTPPLYPSVAGGQ